MACDRHPFDADRLLEGFGAAVELFDLAPSDEYQKVLAVVRRSTAPEEGASE
ncbi:MAG: hypothetical protein IT306_26300 [Chloroflexi bacterium]|nr:hypothetical protein [Chloroflexota bacterium]